MESIAERYKRLCRSSLRDRQFSRGVGTTHADVSEQREPA
jgi:hypothetical protein